MGESTSIEWTDRTWNPVSGCTKVSQGCKNCYAERIFPRPYPGRKFTDVRTHADRLLQPLSWKPGYRVFVNSMSDMFHESLPFEFIAAVFGVMAVTPWHTYQILTKRPEVALRFFEYMRTWPQAIMHEAVKNTIGYAHPRRPAVNTSVWPLPNVWLGTSVEDQKTADERLPLLLKAPASKYFVSCEPLLEWTYLGAHFRHDHHVGDTNTCEVCRLVENPMHAADARGLDWVIVGGESGPKARPFHAEWARTLRAQCSYFGAKVFVKQMGANVWDAIARGHDWPLIAQTTVDDLNDGNCRMRLADRKGGDMNEWPISLRRREFPQ
jgi:protein gp37